MGLSLLSATVAAVVAGATFTGTHAGGGTVRFTVAADGTRLTSYSIRDVPGDTCTFVAGGVAGEWEGTPIVNNAFDYRLHDALRFAGTFPTSASATGTLRLFNRAVSGVKPACDSGTLTWTATATVSTGPPAAEDPQATTARFTTTIKLRRRGRTKLAGRLGSPSRACRSRRRVTLKRGSRTIAATRSTRGGRFSFKRSAKSRGRMVRARVSMRTVPAAVCTAAKSKRVRG